MLSLVEKTRETRTEEERRDFYINASDLTDITLTEEESERLIDRLNRGPSEKAKVFTKEALEFYEKMVKKTK